MRDVIFGAFNKGNVMICIQTSRLLTHFVRNAYGKCGIQKCQTLSTSLYKRTVTPHVQITKPSWKYVWHQKPQTFIINQTLSRCICTSSPVLRAVQTSRKYQSQLVKQNLEKLYAKENFKNRSGARYSTQDKKNSVTNKPTGNGNGNGITNNIWQRFKETYKTHGKILIACEVVTSILWLGGIYYGVSCGLDIIPWLEYLGVSEKWVQKFQDPKLGNAAIALLLYKLISPLRHTITVGMTLGIVRVFRLRGRIPPIPPENKLRSLGKQTAVKARVRAAQRRHKIKHNFEKRRHVMKHNYLDRKMKFYTRRNSIVKKWREVRKKRVQQWRERRKARKNGKSNST